MGVGVGHDCLASLLVALRLLESNPPNHPHAPRHPQCNPQAPGTKKTTYPDDDTLIQPEIDNNLFIKQTLLVKNRYDTGDFSNKQILNFKWKKCQL
jgi:hypothetical protein